MGGVPNGGGYFSLVFKILLRPKLARRLSFEVKIIVIDAENYKESENKLFYKFRLFIEKVKLIRQIRQHQKDHSQRA